MRQSVIGPPQLDICGAKRCGRMAETALSTVMRFVDDLLTSNWPFGPPEPQIFYDPRKMWGDEYASIHADGVDDE